MLIAAVFCMFNRYVDGLATWTPSDPAGYRQRAGLSRSWATAPYCHSRRDERDRNAETYAGGSALQFPAC